MSLCFVLRAFERVHEWAPVCVCVCVFVCWNAACAQLVSALFRVMLNPKYEYLTQRRTHPQLAPVLPSTCCLYIHHTCVANIALQAHMHTCTLTQSSRHTNRQTVVTAIQPHNSRSNAQRPQQPSTLCSSVCANVLMDIRTHTRVHADSAARTNSSVHFVLHRNVLILTYQNRSHFAYWIFKLTLIFLLSPRYMWLTTVGLPCALGILKLLCVWEIIRKVVDYILYTIFLMSLFLFNLLILELAFTHFSSKISTVY